VSNRLSTTHGSASGAVHPLLLRADSYLTDGRRLFRVVAPLIPDAGRALASLEDCRTLQVDAYTPGELYAMGLRTVRA